MTTIDPSDETGRRGRGTMSEMGGIRGATGWIGINFAFELDRHYRPPVWPSEPDSQQQMVHLDIGVTDLAAAVEDAIELGARLADFQPQEDIRVMLDPDGHPFCLYLD
jgi:hypothetical protein